MAKNNLENELSSNLMLRESELNEQLMNMNLDKSGELEASRSSLENANKLIDEMTKRVDSMSLLGKKKRRVVLLRSYFSSCVVLYAFPRYFQPWIKRCKN